MIIQKKEKAEGKHRWYLVVAHAGRERLARYHLTQQGFEVYLPMRAPLIANAKAQPRPMFPRYLFVSVDLDRPGWRAIYSTIGVHSILTTGHGETARPRAVPTALVSALKAREVEGLVILAPKVVQKPCGHAPGDKVRVAIGSRFAGLEAVFEERVDAKRAAVLISLLGRDSRHVVPLASLT